MCKFADKQTVETENMASFAETEIIFFSAGRVNVASPCSAVYRVSVRSPELLHTPVFTLLRTAPVIKQLLSLDIIKAGQNVAGAVNPPLAPRPKSGIGAGRRGEGGGVSVQVTEYR